MAAINPRPHLSLVATLGGAVLLAACAQPGGHHQHESASPYAGQQARAVKALDPRDITALQQGQGMGFAKAAELNGYPGPMHVLELASRLQLTPEQQAASQRLMQEHKARARAMGVEVLQAEVALDTLFAQRQATAERVSAATQRIAEGQARLRAEHLNTHLAQSALLTPEQVQRYNELRGYAR
jgi:Spy/CpxP family protein refolding chaperone